MKKRTALNGAVRFCFVKCKASFVRGEARFLCLAIYGVNAPCSNGKPLSTGCLIEGFVHDRVLAAEVVFEIPPLVWVGPEAFSLHDKTEQFSVGAFDRFEERIVAVGFGRECVEGGGHGDDLASAERKQAHTHCGTPVMT